MNLFTAGNISKGAGDIEKKLFIEIIAKQGYIIKRNLKTKNVMVVSDVSRSGKKGKEFLTASNAQRS